ncbi:NAD-binding protein [Paraburkholderia bonniea]|uniref:NAD-dependent epimerase/dehydratase family protein n=1 Tax=Paraburkholderia bonniea TaxID=2152891 RepID=UPI001291589D|nr:NAD-dependent epimerase/dehydratase family protein [Paraburkholderia bonniea]WJF90896.1 NAD-binding protein [Paraburkholderia bonniea]WJF94210.1 NAD-binding protein [Paraburkholderia bonniea]
MKTPRRLRRPRVLIVGCGDVGLRCVALLRHRAHVFALTTQPERCAALRAAGASPLVGDLDARRSLKRLAGLGATVIHLAPPQKNGDDDRRTRALLAALARPRRRLLHNPSETCRRWLHAGSAWGKRQARIVPAVPPGPRRSLPLVYASTTGVYGDCAGALIDETRPVHPVNARAKRRVSAEQQLRRATARGQIRASIARIPGIYAANRLPLARLERGTPALADACDVYTNHIHADDLAAILVRLTTHGRAARVVHASDDSRMKMGEYFDRVADAFALPRPPRVTREQAAQQLEPVLLSFMQESRCLLNQRLKRELRIRLRYPSVEHFLRTAAQCR